jgi:hypothetical protein
MVDGGGMPGIVAAESNGELHLRQLHELIPARRGCGRQWDDDVAVQDSGEKQRA